MYIITGIYVVYNNYNNIIILINWLHTIQCLILDEFLYTWLKDGFDGVGYDADDDVEDDEGHQLLLLTTALCCEVEVRPKPSISLMLLLYTKLYTKSL